MHQDKHDQRTADRFQQDEQLECLEELVTRDPSFKPTPLQRISLGLYRQNRDTAKHINGGDAA